jgi:diadenosine tetraphosphate (Ap4A) HIT family hydrolase
VSLDAPPPSADDWREDRVGAARRGENPTVLRRMPSGYAVIGDTQFLPGYCVLLADPEVGHLSDLDRDARARFLMDMSLVGEAIERACSDDGLMRVNYEILGNSLPIVHAHVFPRYRWEDPERLAGPVWLYPREEFYGDEHALAERHAPLRQAIGEALDDLLAASS